MTESVTAAQNRELRKTADNALARRGSPVPETLSAEFSAYLDNKIRPYIFAVILVGALGFLLFTIGDFLLVRDMALTSLLLRLLFAGVVVSLTYLLVGQVKNIYVLEAVGPVYVHLAALIWFYILIQSDSPHGAIYAHASVIFVLWMNVGISGRFATALSGSATLTALVFFGVWTLNEGHWVGIFIYSVIYLSVAVFSLVISWFSAYTQRRLFLYSIVDATKTAELQEVNRLLWSQAHTDSLTALPNRSLLMDRLTQALALANRNGNKVGLLFVDLDRFKPVNDTHGHAVGDQLLEAVAGRLQTSVRASDTVARFGGDEFVLVLPTLDSALQAMQVANKIIHALEKPFSIDDISLSVSCSIGVALYPDHGQDEKTLLQAADKAAYHAKAAGRHCAVMAGEPGQQSGNSPGTAPGES